MASRYLNGNRFTMFIIVITLIKVILMISFTSDYEQKLFIPFIDSYIKSLNTNPYDNFYERYNVVAFPYPPLMLFFKSILGGGICTYIGDSFSLICSFFSKLPLLIFDFVGLYFLLKLAPENRRYIGIIYFCSPIILYSTYMHGQLDIIPTSVFMGALYYLLNNKKFAQEKFALLFAVAMLTKLHILAAFPAIVIYMKKNYPVGVIIKCLGIITIVFLTAVLPFTSNTFWNCVLLNKEQSLLTEVYLSFVDLKLYLPIIALLFIYLHEYMLLYINKDLFLSLCGVLFGVFLVLIPPMPGWFVWIVPFVALFFMLDYDNKKQNICIYTLFNLLYLLFFITAHKTNFVDLYFFGKDLSWLKLDDAIYRNTLFTLLSGTLVYLVYDLYQYGVASNKFYKRKGKPFTIGIAGDSGAGKTTMLEIIYRCFGKDNMLQIEGDGDHKWERNAAMWKEYTHLNPKANYLYRQAKDLAQLKRGETVDRVEYDHDTGKFTKAHKINPNRYIVLSGLHAFYLPQMRNVMDLKIYMDTDETLRRFWKIQRDTCNRGYSFARILEQIEARKDDTDKYITPQKNYADLVVSYFDDELLDCCDLNHNVIMSLRLAFSMAIDVEPLVDNLTKAGVKVSYDFTKDLNKQQLVFDGASMQKSNVNFSKLTKTLIPHLDEISSEEFENLDTREGIIQTVILLIVDHKLHMS